MEIPRKVVKSPCSAEITQKKSRFIALCQPVNSEEEAAAFIAAQKKKYYDARHVCFAYCIGPNNELQRFSDDGEPSGTAGKPILDVITGNSLKNTLITVTRYFGGTLLGTGGLVKAYSLAAKLSVEEGLASGLICEIQTGAIIEIEFDYKDMGKFEHLCKSSNIKIADKEFCENVKYKVLVRKESIESFEKEVTNMSNGMAKIKRGEFQDFIFD